MRTRIRASSKSSVPNRGRAALLALLGAAVVLTACRGQPARRPTATASPESARPVTAPLLRPSQFVPADDRAALIELPPGVRPGPQGGVNIRVGDSSSVATVWRLAPQPAWSAPSAGTGGVGPERMRTWLGEPFTWTAAPPAPPAPLVPPASATEPQDAIDLVSLPPGAGISAPPVLVEQVPAPIRWLAPPSGDNHADAATSSYAPNPWLSAALRPALSQPWTLWRARLASPGLGGPGAGVGAIPDADSVAARLGTQREIVWRIAIERLARADEPLARRLAARLGGVISFGPGLGGAGWQSASLADPSGLGVVAPVWTNWPGPLVPDDGLSLLLVDLLAPDLTDAERVARARAWIDTLPVGTAWVVDDAGLQDARSGHPLSTLVLVNLDDEPAAASVGLANRPAPLEMLSIGPMSAEAVQVQVPIDEASAATMASTAPSELSVRIGAWRGSVQVVASPLRASPPGVRIGPLVADLAMPLLAAGARSGVTPAVAPPNDRATVGLLMPAPAGTPAASRQGAWVVYLESLFPPDEAPGDDDGADVVRIFFGPAGAPVAVWRIEPTGRAVREVGAPDDARVVVSLRHDRWVTWAPVPPAAVDARGHLRIGVVRERLDPQTGRRERSAWPRAMVPWQEEPGRLVVDLHAWGR